MVLWQHCMSATRNVPRDLEQPTSDALACIRLGDYDGATLILAPYRHRLARQNVVLDDVGRQEFLRLRLATLIAEVYDSKGLYDEAGRVLFPYNSVVRDLKQIQDKLAKEDAKEGEKQPLEPEEPFDYRVTRGKLYFLWQTSVWRYRKERIELSRELLDIAIDLAERLQPRSESLLTQLYYGAGKLALHEGDEVKATKMYRRSLMNAADRLAAIRIKRKKVDPTDEINARWSYELRAATYGVAKTLALGLGHCLREQSRLEEAHTVIVAGSLLLNADEQLAYYATLLLGSIERSMAGETNKPLLARARTQIDDCAEYFATHHGEVGTRARLESALVIMQQRQVPEAKERLHRLLASAKDAKWIAEANIGLTRAARRSNDHDAAVRFAQDAVKAAGRPGMIRILRRAETVLVLAMYEHATVDGFQPALLKKTLKEIERVLSLPGKLDVRTRANAAHQGSRTEPDGRDRSGKRRLQGVSRHSRLRRGWTHPRARSDGEEGARRVAGLRLSRRSAEA